MWLILGLISAVFLGLYDVCKKASLRENAVLPVLFLATVSTADPESWSTAATTPTQAS